MTLFEVAALGGLLFGLVGAILGIVNATRDRRKVEVTLQWDLTIAPGGDPRFDPNRPWGIVKVANTGRRPVFISHVAIRLPRGTSPSHLMLADSIRGERLAEGDAPKTYPVDQAGMDQYAAHWRGIVAQVSDSTGKEWVSKPPRDAAPPSWARAATRTRTRTRG